MVPKWLTPRFLWWAATSVVVTWLAFLHRNEIFSDKSKPASLILFVVSLGLCLLPLFREIEFWGIKLKPEIDRLTEDVKELNRTVNVLHTQLLQVTSIHQSQSVAQTITLSTHEDLDPLRRASSRELEKYSELVKEVPMPMIKSKDDVQQMATVHNAVATELRRIAQGRLRPDYAVKEPDRIIADLEAAHVLTAPMSGLARQVLAISGARINGESLTDAQVDFLSDMGPKLVAALKVVPGHVA